MNIPEMTQVDSNQIHSIGHDPLTNTLHVKFHSGGHYSYDGVDADKFDDFQYSDSKGVFFGKEIKGMHSHTKH